MTDWYSNVHLIVRWLHVIAGITWIGHLYFFNFVNSQVQGRLDDATKKLVNPQLMPRALWWFRWGAMITFLAGVTLFVLNYMYTPGVGFGPTSLFRDANGLTGRATWILIGMSLATMMWYNVWFVIWPIQKALLTGTAPAAGAPAMRARATKASKVNTYLSGPMLFGMLAPAHYGTFTLPIAVVAIGLGLLAVWFAYKSAPAVGKLA